MAEPFPEIVALNTRMFIANLRIKDVLARTTVSRTTWWRVRRGADFPLSKLHEISRAIDTLINEKELNDGKARRDSSPSI